MPYNLGVDEDIRSYLENLDPFNGRTEKEMNDYLYSLSEQVEPRNSKKPPVFVSMILILKSLKSGYFSFFLQTGIDLFDIFAIGINKSFAYNEINIVVNLIESHCRVEYFKFNKFYTKTKKKTISAIYPSKPLYRKKAKSLLI